jgi:hypothetical protein
VAVLLARIQGACTGVRRNVRVRVGMISDSLLNAARPPSWIDMNPNRSSYGTEYLLVAVSAGCDSHGI